MREFLSLWRDKKGVAVVESAFLFPIMIAMLIGMFDIGNGILANQYTITASQVIGDLVTRERRINQDTLDNYITAGKLTYGAGSTSSFGVDVLSVKFDDKGKPQVEWRKTTNMTADANALSKTAGLGAVGEGVVVVTVRYVYQPTFASVITGPLEMKEQSFLRGRRSPVVEWDG